MVVLMDILRKIILGILVFLISCSSSLVRDDSLDKITALEKKIYLLKKDIIIDGLILKKYRRVKVIINPGEDYIKVYAYYSKEKLLQSDRFLILYLFANDFPNEEFDFKFFKKKLYKIVKPLK